MTNKELMIKANEARKNSYAPYSNYKVGAALEAKSGKVYLGCNIENAAYSPSMCAERVAFYKAISEGEKEFVKIAIIGGKGEDISMICAPCGVCRQVMSEHCDNKFTLILGSVDNFKEYTLEDILPLAFTKNEL